MSDNKDNKDKGLRGRVEVTEALGRFQRTAERRLLELLRSVLDSADTQLMARVESSDDFELYTAHHRFATELRRNRFTIEQRVIGALSDAIQRLRQDRSAAAPPKPDLSALSLVPSETLDRDLALEAIVGRARKNNRQTLDFLCQRLTRLATGDPVDGGSNPVDPRQLAEMLKAALDDIDADMPAWRAFFELFEEQVNPQLPDFYRELNRVLADAGVTLPEPGRSRPPPAAAEPRAGGGSSAPGAGRPANEPGQRLILALEALVRSVSEGEAPAPGSGGGFSLPGNLLQQFDAEEDDAPGLPASIQDVVAVLSTLQNVPRDADNDAYVYMPPAIIRRRVREGLGASAGGERMDPAHSCAIEIVSLVFESVLEHPDLPDRMKLSISRLQIPVVKVALLDPALFSERSHPARRLINELTRAAVSWTPATEPEQEGDPLLQCIDEVVAQIQRDFRNDLDVFREALSTFERFRASELQRVRQVEARTRAVAEGKARLSEAQDRAAREIRERCAGLQVPPAVQAILEGPWMRVLSMTLLREGDGSDTWHRYLKTVERLLETVQFSNDHEERRDLVLKIPGVLKELRAGANGIMFDNSRMTELLHDLEGAHIDVLTRPLTDAPPADESVGLGEVAAESGDDELETHLQAVDSLPVDCWLEWRHEGHAPARCRLAARFSGGAWLVLVNRAGFRLAELPRRAMAEELASGRLRQLDDSALFDKALGQVVTELRQQAAS
ncbi:DUF1631 domain-containing protein [Methylonatrum kenyense]|uniref:DUF1631 family protein n=1 Tax=Methylonatrum kenyense TaxID=455253 RepID=UPI0020C055FD|nr:DUF1631 family protein [Methylonatrum kenyense]MCK8517097.1 DUF1631 domain-containing protein [Methylonatrum kenyense]